MRCPLKAYVLVPYPAPFPTAPPHPPAGPSHQVHQVYLLKYFLIYLIISFAIENCFSVWATVYIAIIQNFINLFRVGKPKLTKSDSVHTSLQEQDWPTFLCRKEHSD